MPSCGVMQPFWGVTGFEAYPWLQESALFRLLAYRVAALPQSKITNNIVVGSLSLQMPRNPLGNKESQGLYRVIVVLAHSV